MSYENVNVTVMERLSGIPLVLNTSFNVHEEPIVCGPHEAVQAVVDNRVDHLAIGAFWVDGAQFANRREG